MARIAIKVIVAATHRTDAVGTSLTRMGMTVETTLPEIGVIFGHGEESLLPRLSAADGVDRAVAEGRIDLPPPGDLPQ